MHGMTRVYYSCTWYHTKASNWLDNNRITELFTTMFHAHTHHSFVFLPSVSVLVGLNGDGPRMEDIGFSVERRLVVDRVVYSVVVPLRRVSVETDVIVRFVLLLLLLLSWFQVIIHRRAANDMTGEISRLPVVDVVDARIDVDASALGHFLQRLRHVSRRVIGVGVFVQFRIRFFQRRRRNAARVTRRAARSLRTARSTRTVRSVRSVRAGHGQWRGSAHCVHLRVDGWSAPFGHGRWRRCSVFKRVLIGRYLKIQQKNHIFII